MTQKIWTGRRQQKANTPRGGVPQHTDPDANARRFTKAVMGARQYRKARKELARAARETA